MRKPASKSVVHMKMTVINDLKSPTLDEEVVKWINNDADLIADYSTSNVNLKGLVRSHTSRVVEPAWKRPSHCVVTKLYDLEAIALSATAEA